MSRKASLEQRGVAIVTAAGTLVTLLFGLVAVVTKSTTFALPRASHGWLTGSVILFVAAIFSGIIVNVPLLYEEAKVTAAQLREVWDYDYADAQAMVTTTRLKVVSSARSANGLKAVVLLLAMMSELGAIVSLGFAIYFILHVR